MIDDTKTEWRCRACGRDGYVRHYATENAHSVIAMVVKDHEAVSPICTETFDKLQVLWSDR